MDPEESLEEYFEEHPEEEKEFLYEMERLRTLNEPLDTPEEWPLNEWLKWA